MQTVEIKLWDDVDMRSGNRVPAEEQVVVEYRGRRVRLDLTYAHAAELDTLLEPWLAAGGPEAAAPEFRHGFKPGSKEARDWRAGLRHWADSAGRTAEYMPVPRRDGLPAKLNYRYPLGLVRDYEAHLVELAKAA
jgi:hypothetical protein